MKELINLYFRKVDGLMFIEDKRIEEISWEITEKGIGILQKIDSDDTK